MGIANFNSRRKHLPRRERLTLTDGTATEPELSSMVHQKLTFGYA